MANEEHLVILRQGVEVWDEWRAGHDGARPDLSGANLRRANLTGMDLIERSSKTWTNKIPAILVEKGAVEGGLGQMVLKSRR